MKCGPKFYQSTVGKKVVVALTGLVLYGFVFGHMLGNLKAFMGSDEHGVPKLDSYARFLREMGEHLVGYGTLLWIARIVLLLSVIVHVLTVIQLKARSSAARPTGYHGQRFGAATLAARVMWWGGVLLACFIIFHILHFTTGQLHFHGFVEGRVYSNVYRAFQDWTLVGVYVVAMASLYLHLYHGGWSLFQTLGIDSPDRNQAIGRVTKVIAFVIAVGFLLVPLGVASGILPRPSVVQGANEEY